MSGDKSFNVYKKSERQNQASRLRQSNSFYQVNNKESMENLYKNSKFLPLDKNQSFTQGTNHHLSSSLNLGNNVEFQNFMREQGGLDRSMNNYYLANLRRRASLTAEEETGLLKNNWSKIVKDISKIISYLMKSSSLMANNLSHIIGKLMKHDKNFQKLRSLIIKFLNESFNRHRRFISEINNYKNCKSISVPSLIKCIENLIGISQIESDSQGERVRLGVTTDSISKSIKNILSVNTASSNQLGFKSKTKFN